MPRGPRAPRALVMAAFAIAAAACSGSSRGGGDDGGGTPDLATASPNGCPTVNLPTSTTVTYSGDTTGKPNLVTSARLEWGDAPDDALFFRAPAAGTYLLAMPSEPSTNGGCGASAQEYNTSMPGRVYDETACPPKGSTNEINGIYTAIDTTTGTLTLGQNQHVIIWVSCTTWSSAQSGPYSITLTK
jgi:hypothetical protein